MQRWNFSTASRLWFEPGSSAPSKFLQAFLMRLFPLYLDIEHSFRMGRESLQICGGEDFAVCLFHRIAVN